MRGDNARERDGKPGPTRHGLLDTLTIVFAVAACLGLFFYFSRPANNEAVVWFRLGLAGVGCIGLVVVLVLKLALRRES